MAQETDKKKKLYAEEDISKLAVIKSNDTIARKYMMCVATASTPAMPCLMGRKTSPYSFNKNLFLHASFA